MSSLFKKAAIIASLAIVSLSGCNDNDKGSGFAFDAKENLPNVKVEKREFEDMDFGDDLKEVDIPNPDALCDTYKDVPTESSSSTSSATPACRTYWLVASQSV